MTTPADGSLYSRLGGSEAVEQVTGRFYAAVLDDPLLAPHFYGVDMQVQAGMLASFLSASRPGARESTGAVACGTPTRPCGSATASSTGLSNCGRRAESRRDQRRRHRRGRRGRRDRPGGCPRPLNHQRAAKGGPGNAP